MSEPGENADPANEHANVASAGEPSEPHDTRDLALSEEESPSHEELDEREERFTGPRKAMGPPDDDDPPETTPESEG